MNQHLQTILNFIQQSEHLTDEEKTALVKAAKDADKELEITSFKLGRTEKVKRTTAILLEETIEELEQKRKAVEAQNRELEIESSLERVRTVAMSMNKADDMLEVCKIISHQLELLAVKDIRNVQTAIFYKEKGTYMNYEYYAKHDKTFITETTYINNEIHEAFAQKMLKGNGEFFITYIKDNEVKEWIAYQKTTNVFIDTFLETATSLNYYWYSLGPVALGISTYNPLTEDEINLFRRFLKVFELAYRRYLDIEKAAAQAKEAQIELALERVRARTMAMQKSDELSETAFVLFQQFNQLGEAPDQITIGNINEEERVIELWLTMQGAQMNRSIKASIDEPTVMHKMYAAWKQQKKSLVIDLSGKELAEYINYRNTLSESGNIPYVKNYSDERRVINAAFSPKGLITFSTPEPKPKETIQLLERFAGVFEQTYTRFLDLQKAEAQSRESLIQLALERVRARTMAMQQSNELADTASVLFQQIKDLGFETWSCGFCIWTKNDLAEVWMAADSGGLLPPMMIPYKEEPTHAEIYKALLRVEPAHDKIWEGKELEKHYAFLKTIPSVKTAIDILEKSGLTLPSRQCYYVGFFKEGYLLLITKEPNEGLKDLSKRFASVFDLTYRRFLDLQKAEAQAKEAKIEAALERTRTQSMIMQHSKELDDTLRVFHEQVLLLNIPSSFSFLWLPDEDKYRHIFWAAWAENNSTVFKSKAINYPLDRNEPSTAQCLSDWKSNQPVVSYHVLPEGVENYFAAWSELISGVEQLKPEYFSDGLYYVEAFMKYGCFGVMVKNTLHEKEEKILERFATEFERAYTRFLDLQKSRSAGKGSTNRSGIGKSSFKFSCNAS